MQSNRRLVIANPCSRCLKGAMFTRYDETNCYNCGFYVVPDEQLETTKAWLTARNNA